MTETASNPDCLSIEEFARRHRISRAQAYKEISSGRLVAVKVGVRTLILSEHAAEWRKALPRMVSSGEVGQKRKGEAEARGTEVA